MKTWYESKTIWLALLQGIGGLLFAFAGQYPTIAILMIGKSIIDIVIRLLTVAPIGDLAQ